MTTAARRALLVVGVGALLVGHVVLLHRVSVRIALPLAVMLAVMTVVGLLHLGVVRRLTARFRASPGTKLVGHQRRGALRGVLLRTPSEDADRERDGR